MKEKIEIDFMPEGLELETIIKDLAIELGRIVLRTIAIKIIDLTEKP